jgi:serine/threonine-protein kinase RsbW/stage II sporulation protein AB (anti-sigma F factor)
VVALRRRPPARLDLDLPAVPDSAAAARHAVVAYAAPVLEDTFAVGLAVQEAATNAIVHAFRDRPPGRIAVQARIEQPGMLVVVADDGMGMVPRPDTPGLGLGLPLIAQLAETLQVEAVEPSGTRLVMRFAR